MEKSNIRKSLENFTVCVVDLQDELRMKACAMQAFGTLLREADLADFTTESNMIKPNEDYSAVNLRWGLSQIIDLYLSDQKRTLTGYEEKYYSADTTLVRSALIAIQMVKEGAFATPDTAIEHLKKALDDVSVVLEKDGLLNDIAGDVKRESLELMNELEKRKDKYT